MKINELTIGHPQKKNPDFQDDFPGGRNWQGDDEANYPTRTHTDEPKMDLEFKTDIKPVHTDTDPDYSQEIAPDGIPQDIYNQLRDKSQERKPESEWNLPSKDSNHYIDKLKKAGGFWLDTVDDAGQSIGRGIRDVFTKGPSIKRELQGIGDFGGRFKNRLQNVMSDDVNRMRKLAGLMEKDEDVWAYSPLGQSDIVARVVKTDYGFQVYVRGPHGWIAQGQPHMSQEEAEADATSFFEAVEMINFDQLDEEQLIEVRSVLGLQEEVVDETYPGFGPYPDFGLPPTHPKHSRNAKKKKNEAVDEETFVDELMEEHGNASPEQLDEWVNFLVAPVAGAAFTAAENYNELKQAYKEKTITPELRNELLTDFAKNTALSTGVGLGAGALGKIGMWAARGGNPIKSIKNVVSNIKRRGQRKWDEIRGPSRRAKMDKDIAAHNKDKFGESQIVSELWPAVAAGAALGIGKYAIDQASKPEEERTYYKLWKRFGPKKKEEKEVVAKESEELNEVLPLVVGGAAALGAGYAGYKWLKGLKGKTKDQKGARQANIDKQLKDSIDPHMGQPWWSDMDSTLQEMKAEMLSIPKKK